MLAKFKANINEDNYEVDTLNDDSLMEQGDEDEEDAESTVAQRNDNEAILVLRVEDEQESDTIGLIIVNLNIFLLALAYFSSRCLYEDHQTLEPVQLICIRAFVTQFLTIIWINKKLKVVYWDMIPDYQSRSLILRSIQGSVVMCLQFLLTKYLPLIYLGIIENMAPLATSLLSYVLLRHYVSKLDTILALTSFFGLVIMYFGFKHQESEKPDGEQVPEISLLGLIILPVLIAYGGILQKQMKDFHYQTTYLHVNTLFCIFALIWLITVQPTTEVFNDFSFSDWLLVIFFSSQSIIQKLLEVRYESRGGQLSQIQHYYYLLSFYTFLFDLIFLQTGFKWATWIGLIVVFLTYVPKIYWHNQVEVE